MFTNTTETQTYNGWANRATWNVTLWMQNDEFLYNTAKACVTYCETCDTPYDAFIRCMNNCQREVNGYGFRWDDETINRDEVNEMMKDL